MDYLKNNFNSVLADEWNSKYLFLSHIGMINNVENVFQVISYRTHASRI